MKCDTCFYFDVFEEDYESGICRRYPPNSEMFSPTYRKIVQLTVSSDDWCGEYKSNE